MRRRLTTPDPSEFSPHDHVIWSGDGQQALEALAVAAFTSSAKRGEQMVLVTERPDPARLAELNDLDDLIERGALRFASVDETYAEAAGTTDQREVFEGQLDQALADGYTGLCVVADNSRLASGTDAEFAAWLAWEATADQLQAARPIVGICYFDRDRVSQDRLADLTAIHPSLSADLDAPSFQLFVDGDAVRVVGDLDTFCADQLGRLLSDAPKLGEAVLDLSGVEFVNHRSLLVLNACAASGRPIRLRGAPTIVRRVWDVLDVSTRALEFSA